MRFFFLGFFAFFDRFADGFLRLGWVADAAGQVRFLDVQRGICFCVFNIIAIKNDVGGNAFALNGTAAWGELTCGGNFNCAAAA